MKKLLVLAMVAFAFLACNEGASVPSKDKKAAKAVTSQAFDLLGSDAATVDKALADAGFTKVEGGALIYVAERKLAHVRKNVKAQDEGVEVTYLYNVPEDYSDMSEKEATNYAKGVLDKGECIMMVMAYFYEDKLISFMTNVIAPLKDNINLLFTEVSDAEYKKLPEGSVVEGMNTTQWEGGIDNERYTDHAKFVSKVAKAQTVSASEQGYAITKMDVATEKIEGFLYNNYWVNPDEEAQEEQVEESGFAAAAGVFTVSYPYQYY
jgi:hypothetical protein